MDSRAPNSLAPEDALAELRALRQRVEELYKREDASVIQYVRKVGDRTVVGRIQDASGDNADDPTDHMTCSCFTAAHLALMPPSISARNPLLAHGPSFVGSSSQDVLETVVSDFQGLYVEGNDGVVSNQPDSKEAGGLPNPYNTSLHLCGLVAALTDPRIDASTELIDLGFAVMSHVVMWLSDHDGFAPEDKSETAAGVSAVQAHPLGVRTAYRTYWCVRSIVTWLDFVDSRKLLTSADVAGSVRASRRRKVNKAESTLDICLQANLSYLCRILVAHFAEIGTTFDADDIVCMTAAVAIASRRRKHRDEFIVATLPLAVNTLLGGYVHRDGSYVPNAPILEPREGRPVTASTEEFNAILLHAVERDLTVEQALAIEKGLAHAERKSTGPRGWGSSAADSADRRNAFVASGALAFLLAYYAALDRLIAEHCAAQLGIHATDRGHHRGYLSAQAAALVDELVPPLTDPRSRNSLAITSVVLGGPRSEPKERIAARIAERLEWPMLTIDPVSFLGDENSGLDLEIKRNLDYLSEISNTVVFFDAVDDWLQSPSNSAARRLLSWSMLARLDQLTASRRILLVVACEDPQRLKLDQPRAGRLDKVIMLDPLTRLDRGALIDHLFNHYGANESIRSAFEEADVIEVTDKLSEGHLRELVRASVLEERSSGAWSTANVTKLMRTLGAKGAGQDG